MNSHNTPPVELVSPAVCGLKRGFTLVEMLVVVAIIGVLAALMFPMIGKMRDSASSAASTNSMRQLGVIFTTIAADNNSTLPVGWVPIKGNFQKRLSDYVAAEFGSTVDPSDWVAAFQNKLATSKEKFKPSTAIWIGATPYGINKRFSDATDSSGNLRYGNTATGTWTVLKLPKPANTVVLGDGWINAGGSAGSQLDPNNTPGTGESISYRHPGNRAALMFADWHIELVTKEDVAARPGWFDPSKQK